MKLAASFGLIFLSVAVISSNLVETDLLAVVGYNEIVPVAKGKVRDKLKDGYDKTKESTKPSTVASLNKARFTSLNEFGVPNQTVLRQLTPTYELLTDVFGRRLLAPIEFRQESPPRILYRLKDGHRVIQLNTSGTEYRQYTYQFAHELGHMLTNFHLSEGVRKFQWFEETLAELASYYVLSEFVKQPPSIGGYTGQQWQNYLKANYTRLEKELKKSQGLAIDDPIAPWFPRNEHRLMNDSTMRDINWWMAWHMYPYFKHSPEVFWQACGQLNTWDIEHNENFKEYLDSWEFVLNQQNQDVLPVEVLRFLFFDNN